MTAWFRKNVFQGCDGGFEDRAIYFETVDWATSKPSIRSSPWIRDAPQSGFSLTHPPDQFSQTTLNPRPPCPITRFPTPKHFETSAMPTQDGLRLNHLHGTKKTRPKPRHPYEQRAITATQSETRWCPPQSDGLLMAEKQILSLKPAPRLEQVCDEHSGAYKIANIALNDAMILPYNANPGRMEFSERTGIQGDGK